MSKPTKKDAKKCGPGKKHQNLSRHSQSSKIPRTEIKNSLDAGINLWYNKEVKRWRWTLLHDDDRQMESGDAKELEKALNDIRRTIEWVMETQEE